MSGFTRRTPSSMAATAATGGFTLAAVAIANHLVARRTERRHPPTGSFVDVEGVRLHYSDRGQGSPIVLIHGNMVTGDDYNTSGLAEILLKKYRVIIFDRPGFGHSGRPRGRIGTVDKQADLLHHAIEQLGIVRPVVVGHSWGAIVAVAMAVRHKADSAGVVALPARATWSTIKRPQKLRRS